ncbi:MAG: PorP/SprF family type IX secretion system membrane protein [Bacteroidetes bacterium]|nr:PorP/SprF family type IX secretion system membrane protein [Bacteroidota bacterium]
MKNSIITTALVLTGITAMAQQMPFSSQYYSNFFVTNPAFTGTKENTNAFLTHRSQWTGVTGGPQTSYLTIDGPIQAKNIGLGLKIYSDVTDITSRMGAFANYSYKLKINDDNNLFFGLAVGVLNNRIDFSKAVVRDADDPLMYTAPQSKTVFSSDFGLGYTWKQLEVGFAMPQFIGNKIKYKDNNGGTTSYQLARHYQGSVKYTFDVNKDKGMTAYPLIMVRGSEGSTVQYDINAVFDWQKYGWVGVTYHSNYAVAASIGLRYKNISAGYAYDFNIGKVKNYMGTSSEFLLSYTFGSKKVEEEPVAKDDGKDAVVDAAIAKLKADSDSSKAEMERLKAELLKLKNGANGTTEASKTESLTEQLMRVASSNDFVDDNGMSLGAGFYVVIGTFSNKANATKFKDANMIKGYNGTQIIQNHKTKVYYVYVKQLQSQTDAELEQQKYKAEYPDVWIQKLE